jgi:hypothetical protein
MVIFTTFFCIPQMKNSFRLNGKNIDSIGLQHDELEIGTQCSIHGWGFQSYVSMYNINELFLCHHTFNKYFFCFL